MADPTLTPTYFDGTSIKDATYTSKFLAAHDVASTPDVEPVEVETPGEFAFPTTPRAQPQSQTLPLYVKIARTQAALYAFKLLFDPAKGDCILKADDGDGTTWRMTVRVIGIPQFAHQLDSWVVRLYAARPIWESDTQHSEAQPCDESPETWTETVVGTQRTYPIFEIKPTVAASHAAKYLRRFQVIIASRTELPMVSTNGLAYPIDIVDGGLDTATEIAASRMQADGDDLRVYVDGVEIDRWLSGIDTANTKVWCNITFSPMRKAGLANNMTAGSPANGEWFDVVGYDDTLGWDDEGFLIVDDECIHYDARTLTAFRVKTRGARETTAAIHTASSGLKKLYWVEHEIVILYDNEAAADPPTPVDHKPVIDLANSTNLVHKYPTLWTAPGSLRTGQFLRRYTNDNLLSAGISYLEDGTDARFRDTAPSAAALRYNGLELSTPCSIKAAAGAITHDVIMEDGETNADEAVLALRVLGIDLEGLETLLETYDRSNIGAAKTIQPAAVLSRIRYNAVNPIVTGARIANPEEDAEILAVANKKAQGFTLDADTVVSGWMVRLKRGVTALSGDFDLSIWDEVDGKPGPNMVSPALLHPFGGLTTSYRDYVVMLGSYNVDDIVLRAGTYYLQLYRTDISTGNAYWSISLDKVLLYSKGYWFEYAGAAWSPAWVRTARFGIIGVPTQTPQTETAILTGHQIGLDDIQITFDNTTPRTPKIVVSAQEEIYHLAGVLKNDDTGQEITLNIPLVLNETLTIDCEAHTVVRSDTGEAVPGACSFSDLEEWMRADPGTVNLRWTEAGIGTVQVTVLWRDRWA